MVGAFRFCWVFMVLLGLSVLVVFVFFVLLRGDWELRWVVFASSLSSPSEGGVDLREG